MKKNHFLLVLLILIGNCLQAQMTTSGLSGRIKDESGFLPGATVQALHLPSGTRYGTVTNEEGLFTLQGMRPGGPYEVTVSFIGYQTEKFENIQLQLGATYPLNVTLKNETIGLEEVMIRASKGVNASKTGAATGFSIRQLSTLPTVSRSLTDITRLTPQASVNSNGAISFAGANNRYNSFQIDGAMNNDVFGLTSNGTNGGQASTEPVSLESIEQIQVNIAPFDVRQSGFTGGGINAITKSGTNSFSGSAYFYGNNQNLIGKTPGSLKPGEKRRRLIEQHDYQYGLTFGGPLIRNKLFFFANYERTDKSYPTSDNLGDGSVITQTNADRILNHLQSLTGGKYSGNFNPRDVFTRSHKAGLKIDWNISDAHRLTLRYSLVDAEKLNFSRSQYTLRASDAGYVFTSKTHSWIAELNSRIGNDMNNELRASYVRVRDNREPNGERFPSIQIKNVDGGTVYLGTEYSSAANRLDQDILTLTDNFNWLVGKHNLTFGTHNELYFFENLFIQNLHGQYNFNSLDNFLNGKVDRYYYGQSKEEITGRRDFAPSFGAMQIGFYLQDNWSITDLFNLTYGVRIDIPAFLDTPSENPEFNHWEVARAYGVKTDVKPRTSPLWSPRIGFRWHLTPERKQLVRGGVGIFTGRIPFVWLSNSFSNTGMEFVKYDIKNPAFEGFYFNTDPYGQYEMLQKATATKTTEVDVFTKDFKFAQNLRFNLAYEQVLPGEVKLTLEGLYSKTLNDIVYQNINIEPTGQTFGEKYGYDFDLRPLYNSQVNRDYTRVMLLENTSKGYTYNLSAKLEKSFHFGLDLSAFYTYGQSKSLNPGSSSVAYSNWQYNEIIYNPNKPELSYSDFNIPHRVVATLTYSKAYAKHFKTTVSLVYTGQSGAPYNVTYNNDLNGDYAYNDLIYIPTDAQIDRMQFYATADYSETQQRENLKQFLGSTRYLKDHRGKYYKRNADNMKFEYHFDFRLLQDFSFKTGNHTHTLQLSLDIMNVGNMLNKKWGVENYLSNNSYSPIGFYKDKYQFLHEGDYDPFEISDFYSRWRGQLGIKYIF